MRGIHHQHVRALLQQGGRLACHIPVDAHRSGYPQPALIVHRRVIDRPAQDRSGRQRTGERPIRVHHHGVFATSLLHLSKNLGQPLLGHLIRAQRQRHIYHHVLGRGELIAVRKICSPDDPERPLLGIHHRHRRVVAFGEQVQHLQHRVQAAHPQRRIKQQRPGLHPVNDVPGNIGRHILWQHPQPAPAGHRL